MKLLATLAVVLSLAACKKDAAPTGPDNAGGDDDIYACAADEDCVAVEVGCCDACNGGEAVGVHEDHVDEAIAAGPRGQGACETDDLVCTELGCADWIPSCEAGKCEITRGTFD